MLTAEEIRTVQIMRASADPLDWQLASDVYEEHGQNDDRDFLRLMVRVANCLLPLIRTVTRDSFPVGGIIHASGDNDWFFECKLAPKSIVAFLNIYREGGKQIADLKYMLLDLDRCQTLPFSDRWKEDDALYLRDKITKFVSLIVEARKRAEQQMGVPGEIKS